MKINLPVSQREVAVGPRANILSTTDLKGVITYVNPDFIAISGYEEDELLGRSHNLVRHPDMPPAAFADLWRTLKAGRSWMGLVKNRCKNGDHYWVSAFATPVIRDGAVVEYQSVRSQAGAQRVARAEPLYAELSAGRTPRVLRRPRLDSASSLALLVGAAPLGAALLLGLAGALPLLPALGGGALFGAGLAALVRWRLQPLVALSREARRIADNPLSQWVYCGRNDSFGQIAFALRSLEAESGAMVGRIADSARQLNEDVGELAAAVDCSRGASVQQQRETEQVASAVEQLAASVQEVARHAQLSASAAAEANQATDSGLRQVEQTRRQIAALADEVLQGNQVIQRLQAHSQEIDQVIEVIHGIAEQTNLLALNAAIEAARAGEAGRGFAVVADEVRNLAHRTQESAQEIQKMIEELQVGARESVTTMSESQHYSAQSVEIANQAGERLGSVTQRIGEIDGMNQSVATATEEQTAVVEALNMDINEINTLNQEGVENLQATLRACGDLEQQAARLQHLVGSFRI